MADPGVTAVQPHGVRRGTERRTVEQARLDAKAAELYDAGNSFAEIGVALGCHETTALRRVRRILAETVQPVGEQLRATENAKLDTQEALLDERFLVAVQEGRDGDVVRLSNALITLRARRARLHGIDAPIKVEAAVTDAMNAELERLSAGLGLHDPDAAPVTPRA